jgi:VanZ family protein
LKNFVKYQLPPILWIVLIYFLSSLSNFHVRFKIPPGTDKFVHAVIYFVLCWLTRRAFFVQERFSSIRRYALMGAFIFSVVYGALDEYHQGFVPGRTVDAYDLMADAGGALLFVAVYWLLQRRNGSAKQLSES